MARESVATTTPAIPPRNPHDAMQWPYSHINDYRVARLNDAAYGASTIAGLILADINIETSRADSDTPNDEPQPFSDYTRHGLFAALNLCLNEINNLADYFRDCDRKTEPTA